MKINIKLTPFIALVFLISCTPEWEENGFQNEESYTAAIDKGFDSLKDWESFSDGNFDNKEQWLNAMKSGFISKKEFLEAAKYNVNTKDSWLAEIDKSKAGGFWSVGNYFKAKELDISTQKELTKYEYNEIMLSGLRNAGNMNAKYQKCETVSQYLISTTNNNLDKLLLIDIAALFNKKNKIDWEEINERPLNKEETTAFNKAVNSENMGWNTELNNMTGNQKKLMDYYAENCIKHVDGICSVAFLRKQGSLTNQCGELRKFGYSYENK